MVNNGPPPTVLNAPNYTSYLVEINKFCRPQVFIVVDSTLISGWLRNFDLIDEHIDERIGLNVMYRGVRDVNNDEAEDLPEEILQLELWCSTWEMSKFVNGQLILEYKYTCVTPSNLLLSKRTEVPASLLIS